MKNYITLILVFALLYNLNLAAKDEEIYLDDDHDTPTKLKAVLIYVRHGARAPAVEDFNSENWEGLKKGDLTRQGIRQLEETGKLIRQRYIEGNNQLPQQYDPSQIVTSNAQLKRCMVSLLSLLKGMFPDLYEGQSEEEIDYFKPSKELGFSTSIKPDYRDLMYRANDKKNCKNMKYILKSREEDKTFKALFTYFKDHPRMKNILQKLQDYRETDQEIELKGMMHLKEIYDSYIMNKMHGKPIPDWNELDEFLLHLQYEQLFYRFYGFNEARYLEASPFFKRVLNITEQIYNNPDNQQKVFIFSGTKTNIVINLSSLLTKAQILDLGDKKIPELGQALIIEFWENNLVRIRYGEQYLELLQCERKTICTLNEFLILLKTRIYKNIEKLCDMELELIDN